MTENEAIKIFKDLLDMPCEMLIKYDSVISSEKKQALVRLRTAEEFAIKALEKQIPKKPIFDFNSSDTLSRFHCDCGTSIKVHHDIGTMDNNDAPNYCDNCGQKLDWDE